MGRWAWTVGWNGRWYKGLPHECDEGIPATLTSIAHSSPRLQEKKMYPSAFAIVLVALFSLSHARPQENAPVPRALLELRKPLTHLDMETLRANMNTRSKVEFYVKCVTVGEPCDRVGFALRNLFAAESTATSCRGCTESELERVRFVMNALERDHKDLACVLQKSRKIPLFAQNPCL
nr:uncharacterized protein LOC113827832 [Penaeus vannamei]